MMLQPYLASVDRRGETALLYFDGQFSHAIRKAAQLAVGEGARQAPMALGDIAAGSATAAEVAVAEKVLAAVTRLRRGQLTVVRCPACGRPTSRAYERCPSCGTSR